ARYRALLTSVIASWKDGALHRTQQLEARVDVVNWMLRVAKVNPGPLDLPAQKELVEEFRKLEASLPPPRRALACAEGSPVDEKVFLRGNHKILGEIVPRRFLEAFGGTEESALRESRLDLA